MKIGRTLLAAAGTIMLSSIGIANAQTTAPATQGLKSVQKNIAKDTDNDNKGLLTAQQRILRNQQRYALHEEALAERKADRPDRPMRPEHPERPGR